MIDGTGCLIIRVRGARGHRFGLWLPGDDEGDLTLVLYAMGWGVFGVAGILGTQVRETGEPTAIPRFVLGKGELSVGSCNCFATSKSTSQNGFLAPGVYILNQPRT